MNYQIITDKEALLEFIDWLPNLKQSEQYYLSLFARSKYTRDLADPIKHIKSDKCQLKRFTSDKKRMFSKIEQLECTLGSYTHKGQIVPQEALAIYVSINPRDLYEATLNSIIHLGKCLKNKNFNINPHQEVMSEIQKSTGKKHFILLDLDDKDPSQLDIIYSFLNKNCVSVIETKGGYHVLIKRNEIRNEYKNTWFKNITEHLQIDQKDDKKRDHMTPIIGCYQGGFTPKFIKK